MVERTPLLNLLTHAILVVGLLMLMLPLWIVFVASTHDFRTVNTVPMPLWPGAHMVENYVTTWNQSQFGPKMLNSLIMAVGVTTGKIVLAALSAYSIVYFRYRLRMVFFWLIFITLMLPLEVRIVPTYAVAANALRPFQEIINLLGLSALTDLLFGVRIVLPEAQLLNSYAGLILPLIATATGTFLYRQFFLTVPEELLEAAKMDGTGPLRFFWDILLPLSKANMAALATIMFVYSWNQYLWPLLVVTDPAYGTAVMQLQRIVPGPLFGEPPRWHVAMAGTLMVMLPPLLVVVFMQRWFVRGLINQDK
ncbi:MAG: ABC transporter permease subunit [Rhodospirillales bacterium]|jgi:sn-glycerol 3-phosphate transport system permease protein|nr:ABC transporter permease subunit [Rhodospirillales bacterium]